MSRKLFEEGGPLRITPTGPDQYTMSITIPPDELGFIGRECPNNACSLAYFKVKLGTGVTEGQVVAYCPYCRHADEPSDFATKEQIRYAKDTVIQEAHKGISGVIEEAFGLGPTRKKKIGGGLISVEISYKPGTLPPLRRPLEEELRRDITCPRCGLEHAVFGLAIWCPDCGSDIFPVHVRAEYEVIKKMLRDIPRRREMFGARLAARDIENALEDSVSLFEAVLRAVTRRKMRENGHTDAETDTLMKKIGNGYQSIARATNLCQELLDIDLTSGISEEEAEFLTTVFEKRHPITHNLGILDRKYLDRVRSGELEGRDIPVTTEEVERSLDLSLRIIINLHEVLFKNV